MRNNLHVLGVAHTIPHEDYLVCAFTAKVLMFPEVIQPFGWRVIEYSNEGSASKAREHVVILTKDRLRTLSKRASREEPLDADVNNLELQQEFQRDLVEKIRTRAKPDDIVCHVYGPNMEVYDLLPDCKHVEICVGYTASPGLPFRMFESSAWMHWHYGKAGQEDGNHYRWVIPSPIDVESWVFCEEPDDYAIFLGRVTPRKGMNELVDIARRMPELPIHVYGPGNTSQWAPTAPPNLIFKGPVFGDKRVEVVRRARCMLMPTVFIEPFGNSGIEAQLCGVPLIGSSFGAFQETILEGVTGYRCHTLADWAKAIRLSCSLDRRQIASLARAKYSKEEAGRKYDWALRQLADLSRGGWYGDISRKFEGTPGLPRTAIPRKPRIWLYMPYFGAFPSYFQLYLDSLGRNADYLSVFLMTDIDLSGYRLPANLFSIPMTLDTLREKAARFLKDQFGMDVQPDELLKHPYKLVDFKIMYPELFRGVGDRYGVTDDDFVGWGDCDLVYGRFSDFMGLDQDYQIIGGYHGHLTAFRNIDSFRMLFKTVPELPEILLDEKSYIADEIAFRQPLLDFLEQNHYKMFYTNRYFCDIVPECFFELVRADHAHRVKNFFDTHNPDKNIDHVYCDPDGGLTVVYDNGDRRPSIYCHMQKRSMSVDFDRYENGYHIREGSFGSGAPPGRENDGLHATGDAARASSPVAACASAAVPNEVISCGTGSDIPAIPPPEKPQFFFCCGQHGSGSTWMFNLVREICRVQAVDFVSCHRESKAGLPLADLGSRLLVVKTQNPMDDLRSFIANSTDPTTITVREPRDAVVSVMQRFSNSWANNFDEALKAIALSAQRLVALSRLRQILVFRYEDGFVGSVETFDRVAALLGTNPTEDQRAAVLAGLTPEAVSRRISDLQAAGAIRGEEVWDRETHWHANHVGDGMVGKFDGVLSAAQQRKIIAQTREYCDLFGYDVKVDEVPETTARHSVPVGAIPSAVAPRLVTERDEATVLESGSQTETDPFLVAQHTFQLAQSYHDAGETEKAIEYYLRRADLGFSDEEMYFALYRAAQLQAQAKRPADEVLATFQRAIDMIPGRAEAIHGAAHYLGGLNGRHEEGYRIAQRGLALTEAPPQAGRFTEAWIYDYGLLDVYAIHAYWSGHYRDCLDACLRMLSHPSCPEGQRKRFLDNARFAAAKLPGAPNLGSRGDEDFMQQHALAPRRWLHSRLTACPLVMLAIFVEGNPPALPFYLDCIDALEYPKSSVVLYVRANETVKKAEEIVQDWLARVGPLYHSVEFGLSDFSVFGRIRNQSMHRALDLACEFYFVADMGTFIRPQTLRELVALDLPIAAPFLRATVPESRYSNYHAETDNNGYYKECDQYLWLLEQRIRGIVEVPVVNCTYLVRADVIPELTYQDATKRHEYVAFSDSARKAGIPQYLDNRQIYGYVGNGDGGHDLTTISNALGTAGTTKRRVLWRRPGAIGDVLMTLSLVKLHKEKHPGDWVIYQAAPSIADLLRPIMLEAGVDEVATTDEQVVCDKRVDIIGYPFHERHQATPMTRHLLEYFSEELGLRGQYAELKLRLPKRTIEPPYVTLHATSGWSMYKNWPLDRWAWVCQELKKRGIRVVQIGGPDEPAVEGVEFNRLGLTFTESLGLLANAALHIGIDSWSNHATNIIWEGRGKVPGIILWGASQLSATGYPQNQNISLGLPCQPCFRDDPKVSRVPRGVCPNPPEQSYEMPLHACMHGISREFVLDVINKQYAEGFGGQPSTTSILIRRQAHSDRTLEGDEGPSSSLLAPVVAISDESENQALPPQEAPPQFTIEQTNP